jgi:diguanylate cyclase (GGDEF)-like protein
VLYLDLDRLKEANDRLGHAAGDELLRRVAERLLSVARTGDIVGRLGGDEFLVVCRGVPTSQAALEIARRTAVSVGQPISVEGQSVVPSSSMGVAWTNVPMDAEAFVAWGDAAMYQSKRLSAGPVLFGTTTAEVDSERRQSDRTAAVDVEGLTRHER